MFYLSKGLNESKGTEMKHFKDKKMIQTQYDINSNSQSTVRTIELEKTEPIIIGKDKQRIKHQKSQTRESKSKGDKQKDIKRKKAEIVKQDESSKDRQKLNRDNSLVRSLSDPQSKDVTIKNSDKKFIKIKSSEKSEEESINTKSVKLPDTFKTKNPDLSTTDSDSDSAKSLLCSLAPKWLSVGNMRQKRQMRKKTSQEQQSQQNSAGKAEVYTNVDKELF